VTVPNQAMARVAMRAIVKDFPGGRALEDVDFTVLDGEIHGLVGENGAGKSTLVKILAGAYKRDDGEIRVAGEPQGDMSPHDAEALGIHVIHQDRQLVPFFTVAESLFFGKDEDRRGPLLDRRRMTRRAEALIREHLGVEIPGEARVDELSVAQQQLVQITRAVIGNPSVLILDEPTAPLGRSEVERLFAVLRELRGRGISIIYISHYLQEVMEICDRVTVLRNGRNAGELVIAETTADEIVSLMIGREVEEFLAREHAVAPGEVLLEARALRLQNRLDGVDLELRAGEVVGVTGLIGSGASDIARALYGLTALDEGQVLVQGRPVARSPVAMARRGVAFLPEDRRGEGVVEAMSVRENATLSNLRRVSSWGWIRRRAERQKTAELIERLGVRPADQEYAVRFLSGGNQQKVALSKWLAGDAKVFILDQPTAGVDIGARAEIYKQIRAVADAGAAVLVVSYDLPELVGLCDRIAVMYRGRIARELSRQEATADVVLAVSTGAADGGPPQREKEYA